MQHILALLPIAAVILCALLALRLTPRAAWKKIDVASTGTLEDYAETIADRLKSDPYYTPIR